MNDWENYETWNASLWIGNDEFLYNTAKACVKFCSEDETPYVKFIRCMRNGGMLTTGDGVKWDNPTINHDEMVEMMDSLWTVPKTPNLGVFCVYN